MRLLTEVSREFTHISRFSHLNLWLVGWLLLGVGVCGSCKF